MNTPRPYSEIVEAPPEGAGPQLREWYLKLLSEAWDRCQKVPKVHVAG